MPGDLRGTVGPMDASTTAATVTDRTAALDAFCLSHDELFVIPIDELGPTGVTPRFAGVLADARGITEDWIAGFDAAFSAYWERATDLYARAPDAWFPPRLQNVCVVTDRDRTRPYHQPLYRSSWTLDVSDFDPEHSNVEFGAYQLLHAERLATSQDMPRAIIGGLSYWLTRTEEELAAFGAAAANSARPDAKIFERLAAGMSWVRTLFHPTLCPPPGGDTTGLRPIREGSLMVPAPAIPELQQLVADIREDVRGVVNRYQTTLALADQTTRRDAAGNAVMPGQAVCQWLAEERPDVLVTDAEGNSLWDPETPSEVEALEAALEGALPQALQSLQADLKVVGDKTRAFLSSLRDPDALPLTTGEVEQSGGVFLHDKRRVVVYSLEQPGLDPRREPAPAYHRMLLAARTIHEWGHLADAAGWLGVPDSERDAYQAAKVRVGAAVDAILDAAPEAFQKGAADHAESVGRRPGEVVCDLLAHRIPDYVSNLLARRYLQPAELEAYVRANVHPHFDEVLSPLQLLARHAFEYQYLGLGLCSDPQRYFLQSTWFSTYLIDTGAIELSALSELLGAVGELCGCYRVDEAAFGTTPN